jgi:hypothetical protein
MWRQFHDPRLTRRFDDLDSYTEAHPLEVDGGLGDA